MTGRKERNIKIREDRLDRMDDTKMQVAVWLIAKGAVEDRTNRPQPEPEPEAPGDDPYLQFGDKLDDAPEAV